MFINFCVIAATQLIMGKLTDIVCSSEHLALRPLTDKSMKNPTKSAINDQILLKCIDANYDNFYILLNVAVFLN